MVCEVCSWDAFVPAEYVTIAGRAPALECARCHALNLTPDAARSEDERELIRHALAVRAAICESNFPRRRAV
jgi:hypothetical protein